MGNRLAILLWPLRMTGRVARRLARQIIPDPNQGMGPAHSPPPGDARPARTGGVPAGAYIKPAEATDGASEGSLTISQLEVRERIQRQEELVLLDVREAHEVDLGYIRGAVHIPLGEVGARFQELDPGHTVVAYCATGVRSADAARRLRDLGFPRVHSLAGGFARWVRDGGDIARPGQAASAEPSSSSSNGV